MSYLPIVVLVIANAGAFWAGIAFNRSLTVERTMRVYRRLLSLQREFRLNHERHGARDIADGLGIAATSVRMSLIKPLGKALYESAGEERLAMLDYLGEKQ